MMRRCSEEKRVVVRIWHAKWAKSLLPEEVGHISIETFNPSRHMSLWPKKGAKKSYFLTLPSEQKETADEDIADEKRPADKIICFYSLNPQEIVDRFQQIISDTHFKGWTLIGNNRLVNGGNAHSCASLAYSLLKAGGVHRLVSATDRSHPSISMSATPDELANFSLRAKKYELLSFPETKNFTFKRNFKVSIVDPKSGHRYLEGIEKETEGTSKNYCSFFRKHPYLTLGMSITAAAVGLCCKLM